MKKTTTPIVTVTSETEAKFLLLDMMVEKSCIAPYSLQKAHLRAALKESGKSTAGKSVVRYAIGTVRAEANILSTKTYLSIGCQRFERAEAEKIYKWARVKFPF